MHFESDFNIFERFEFSQYDCQLVKRLIWVVKI